MADSNQTSGDGWVIPNMNMWSPDQLIPSPDNAYGTSGRPSLVVFQDKLYCIRQGRGDSSNVWCATFDGQNWSGDQCLPSYTTAGAPSLIVFQDKLYCITTDSSGWVWCGTFDGQSWSQAQLIPAATDAYGASGPPSLAVYQDTLYCIRQGQGGSNEVWCATFDGENWSGDQCLPSYTTAGAPSLIVFQGKLYCITTDSSGWVWCGSFDGQSWSQAQLIPTATNAYGASGPPSLAVYQGTLYCIREGRQSTGWVWCATFDGQSWSVDQLIPSADNAYGTSGAPSLIVFGGTLYCIREGQGDSGWVWCATFDGQTWSMDQLIPSSANAYGTSGPPSLIVFGENLYCIRQGRGDSGWVWCASLPSTCQLYPTLTVYIWSFQSYLEACGHASMQLGDGTYISWWPTKPGTDNQPVPASGMKDLPYSFYSPAVQNRTFQDDVAAEGREPDLQIEISVLDSKVIKQWWGGLLKSGSYYNLIAQNCSTTVWQGLQAANAANFLAPNERARLESALVWKPVLVEEAARILASYY